MKIKPRPRFLPLLAVLLGHLAAAGPCRAAVIYVDNRRGDDAYDGRLPEPVSPFVGPVQTIARGLQLARTGDTVHVASTGVPYYESLALFGPRHSGFSTVPFTIAGNGAVVDGAVPVPASAWREIGPGLWKMTPWRKGHYQLLLGDAVVPEHRPAPGAADFAKLPVGEWTAWKGSIYYRAEFDVLPPDEPFRFAYHGVGLSLYRIRYVHVRDLTFRNFRLDGINAHDLSSDVVFENVRTVQNGRAGVAVGGSASVLLRGCELAGNRMHSLLVTEQAAAEVEESKLDEPATVAK